MKNNIVALVVGVVFAIGLGVSGMTRPEKVFGFLDVFGSWDPSLLFVMLGAVLVHFIAFKAILGRPTPLLSGAWHLPTKTQITAPLVAGSFIFGVGWGLGGYCPGPALTSLASFQLRPILFFASMLFGMFVFLLIDRRLKIVR